MSLPSPPLRPITSPRDHHHHSQLIRLGLSTSNHSVGQLIKSLLLSPNNHHYPYALKLLHSLPNPDQFIYNTPHLLLPSFPLYILMLQRNRLPNKFTFPSLLKSNLPSPPLTRQVHAHVMKFGFGRDRYCLNGLIRMYLGFGMGVDARRVVDGMEKPDAVSWTTMISGLARGGRLDEAREVFDSLEERGSASWNAMIAAYVQVLIV